MPSIISTNTTTGLGFSSDTSGNMQITASSGVIDTSGNSGSLNLPIGTTAQRPSLGTGQLRYNTTTKGLEFSDGSTWNSIAGSSDTYYSATKVLIKSGSLTDCSYSRRTLTNGGSASSTASVGQPPVTKLSTSLSGSGNGVWYVDSNSSNAYVSFGGSLSDFDMGQSAWTLEMWIYIPSGNSSYAHIFWCGGQSGQGEVKVGSDYKPYIYSSAGQAIQSSTAVPTATWTWVVFERYNGTISSWINGANRSQSSTMPTGGTPSAAAIGYPFNGEYFGHYLDEVRWSTVARYQGAPNITLQTTSWPEH